jgi:molecular chaperone DnaK (HSP70)
MFAAFTVTGRLIGDAAKNQVAMNPSNTVFGKTTALMNNNTGIKSGISKQMQSD